MVKRIIISAFLLFVIAISAIAGYFSGFWRFNYPSNKEYPVRGIDVSHHQGVIDWDKISKQRVDFVFIKATQGGYFKGPEFLGNWINAAKYGISRGAYHFFTFRRPGAVQAKNFIDTVPIEAGTLPPVVDFEFTGNSANLPSKQVILKELSEFIRQVEIVYGKTPIIYVTQSSYRTFFKNEDNHYRFWVRNIFFKPDLSDMKKWVFWQYGNNGRIIGIKGRVDLNVFNGSRERFRRLIEQKN